ncbi:hypothetical protein AX17_001360 [Amanita inopinata Kibby_2008]|nr:hypothetical protein AX17_001360 [Amanita inopinata Kibby_2008]
MWFFYFARITHEARHRRTYRGPPPDVPGFTEIASFFAICVWLVPLFLFLSLSANDNALPLSVAEPGSPSIVGISRIGRTRVSLIRSIFSLFSFDIFPRVRSRASRKDTSEGLIAPRSPKPQSPVPPPTPPMPSSSPRLSGSHSPMLPGTSRYNHMPPPSPGSVLRFHEFESNLSTNVVFKLGTPPNRRPGAPIRRQTTDTMNSGRRVKPSVAPDD